MVPLPFRALAPIQDRQVRSHPQSRLVRSATRFLGRELEHPATHRPVCVRDPYSGAPRITTEKSRSIEESGMADARSTVRRYRGVVSSSQRLLSDAPHEFALWTNRP